MNVRQPRPRRRGLPLLAAALLAAAQAVAEEPGELDSQCVLDLAASGGDGMTLAELRARCRVTAEPAAQPAELPAGQSTAEATAEAGAGEPPLTGVVERRLAEDRAAAQRPYSVIAHRPNYFLFAAYNAEGWSAEALQLATGDPDYANKDVESQFQVSLKVPLAVGLFNDRVDIYGAYTNRSFWQVYNDDYSEPFRETNHEPELWAQFQNDWRFFGLVNTVNTVGFVHQSNGRGGELSRGWDRLFATFVFEREHWALAFKPWLWVSPDKDSGDNPDIDEYMGHGEIRLVYGRKGHVFSAMARNQLESGFDRGAVELSWSFPVFDYPYLRGYLQYFYGYGESLLDYDQKANRIGLGISVTDWLD